MGRPAPESASLAAGALSALGASSCCALPLVLVTVGLSGAWVARMRELERFYPLFLGIALGAFGYAFYRLYLRRAPACAAQGACAPPLTRRRQRVAFWTTLIFAAALVLAPYYAPYLLA